MMHNENDDIWQMKQLKVSFIAELLMKHKLDQQNADIRCIHGLLYKKQSLNNLSIMQHTTEFKRRKNVRKAILW